MKRALFIIAIIIPTYPALAQSLEQGTDSLKKILTASSGKHDSFKLEIIDGIRSRYLVNNSDSALVYAKRQMLLARKLDKPLLLADAFYGLGRVYNIQGKQYLAIRNFIESQKIAEQMHDDRRRGRALFFTALVNADVNKSPTQSIIEFDTSLKVARKAKDTVIMSYALRSLALLYREKKDTVKALQYLEQALTLVRLLKDEIHSANVLNEIASINIQKGNFKVGMEYHMKALRYFEGRKDFSNIAETAKLIGDAQLGQRKTKEAIRFYEYSIKAAAAANALGLHYPVFYSLSQAYRSKHDYLNAHKSLLMYYKFQDSTSTQENAKKIAELQLQTAFDKKTFADSLKTDAERKKAAAKLKEQRIYSFAGAGIALSMLLLSFIAFRSYKNQKRSNSLLAKEKNKSEQLLLNILPSEVADELKEKGHADAKLFDNVTVLFTDFVGFTRVSEHMSPQDLVNELHTCFMAYDHIIASYGIEKIKTIGDAYLAVGGLPLPDEQHACKVINAAIAIHDFMKARKEEMQDRTFEVRIGIHSGPVVAGIVGIKKFAYDIWGDTVNTAARMEQSSEPGKINISAATYGLIKDRFECRYRGEIAAKNKGAMQMYFVEQEIAVSIGTLKA